MALAVIVGNPEDDALSGQVEPAVCSVDNKI